MQEPVTRSALENAPAGARCAVHPETPASVVCARCGNYCCPQCGVMVGSRYLCTTCFEIDRSPLDYGDASKTQRVLNFLIDSMCGRLVPYALIVGLVAIGLPAGWAFLPSIGGWFAYYVILEGKWQITIGKLVTKTKVVTESGGVPSYGQIIGRTLSRIVPFDGLSFLVSDRGWHDSWSGTRVVRATPPDWMKKA